MYFHEELSGKAVSCDTSCFALIAINHCDKSVVAYVPLNTNANTTLNNMIRLYLHPSADQPRGLVVRVTTNREVPGSISASTVGNFPEEEDSRGDHGLGRLVEFWFKRPSWHSILLYHHSHHRDNVTAPHRRPNLTSRLHCCHVQEGGLRSPQGIVVAFDNNITVKVTSLVV